MTSTKVGTAVRPADLVVLNAKITTAAGKPDAEAMAITGDRITYVGDVAGAKARIDSRTVVYELNGERIIPGLIDSHLHLVRAGLSWVDELHWAHHRSLKDALEHLREAAKTPPPSGWLAVIGGWHPGQFQDEARLPTRAELDEVVPNLPVYIQVGYQRAILNSKALEIAKITADAPDPTEGTYHRDSETNEPTGLIEGRKAFPYVISFMTNDDLEYQMESTKSMLGDLRAVGLTGAIDTGGGARMNPDAYQALYRVHRAGQLDFRVRLYLHSHASDDMAEMAEILRQNHPRFGDDYLRTVGLGEIISHASYDAAGLENHVIGAEAREEVKAGTIAALKHGFQVNIHGVQDSSVAAFMDLWEEIDKEIPISGRRLSVSHADGVSRETLERIKKLGVGITIQNRLSIRGVDTANAWGWETMDAVPPLRDMIDLGIMLGGGTDATVAGPYNPWICIEWLVTGKLIDGGPSRKAPHLLTREEALTAYTVGSAWFSFDDQDLGTLEEGKLADFVVLSDDYFTVPDEEIANLTSQITFVGGKAVYVAPEREDTLPAGLSGRA